MKSILIISKSPLDRDPRVYKQILFLKQAARYRVTSAGTAPSGIEDRFYSIAAPLSIRKDISLLRGATQLRMGNYEQFYWSEEWTRDIVEHFSDPSQPFDLVIANDVPALPAAQRIAKRHGAKLYLDAHEYQPLHYGSFLFNFFVRDYWHWICKKYLPMTDCMTAVCQGIADEYTRNFGVRCQVVMNLPFPDTVEPVDRQDAKVRMIHHGHAAGNRHLESMLRLMPHLDSRFELDFMLVGMDSRYGRRLRSLAGRNERISFRPTVAMLEIPKAINAYDLGLYLLAPDRSTSGWPCRTRSSSSSRGD